MTKVSRIWLWLFLIFIGFSGGIIVGVIVDVDTVYETTVKKLKQKNSPGGEIVVDIEPGSQEKSKKEIRKEEREAKKEARKTIRNERENARSL